MAVAKPFGLSPYRTTDANTFTEQGSTYNILSSDANAWYMGDACLSTNNADANGISAIKKATVGTETLRGVVVGFINPFPSGVSVPSLVGSALALELTTLPATKTQAYYALVVDDAGVVFLIQDDGITTGNLVAANANKNFSLTIANGATGQSDSGTVMLSSSLATTAGLNMKAFGLEQFPGNVFGAFAIWQSKINQHEFNGNTAGV